MLSLPSIHHPFLWIIDFFIFSLFFSLSSADPPWPKASVICGPADPPADALFVYNLDNVTQCLASRKPSKITTCQTDRSNPKIYALSQCRFDMYTSEDCSLCINEASLHICECNHSRSIRIFLDGCFLRYDTYDFFDEALDKQYDKVICTRPKMHLHDYLTIEFANKVTDVLDNITQTALNSMLKYAVAEVTGGKVNVYGLAQCWESLDKVGCKDCLEDAGNELKQNCLPMKEGKAMNTGCYVAYSTERLYKPVPEDYIQWFKQSRRRARQRLNRIMFAIFIGSSILFTTFSVCGACMRYIRLSWMRKERHSIKLSSSIKESELTFKYEILEKATEGFHPSNKLGQGAAGSVFKATLPCGKTVAIKRLVFNTRQWVDEFFNEVNLISSIKHKNLVRLLGCSLEGPQSLLIYEYLSNGSLDQLLFDKNKTQVLTWQQRFNIIHGITEGLAFLHGGSATKIIHRDVKCSNILLDENLTAKIGDFGLVRCVGTNQTHMSTNIVGTLRYLAPEYLGRGQLTEKAVVYSFGVLVIEIVCARRSNIFMLEEGSVLHTVWKHYKSSTLPDSVDSRIKNDFPTMEASKVLQIALLCTQSSPNKRPSISTVVEMLTIKDFEIPLPRQPPFLNSTWIENESAMTSIARDRPVPDVSSNTLV